MSGLLLSGRAQALIWSIAFVLSCPAQDLPLERFAHSAYVEMLGTGGIYSLNYELRYDFVAFRLGGVRNSTIFKDSDTTTSTVWGLPMSILLLSNRHSNSTAELGFGITPTFGARRYNQNEGTKYPADWVHYDYDAFGTLQFGYRYQPREKPLIFRIDLTLLFLSKVYDKEGGYTSSQVQPWGGISIGYVFRCRPSSAAPPSPDPSP